MSTACIRIVFALCLFAGFGPALAQFSPIATPALSVSPGHAPPGSAVRLLGSDLAASTSYDLRLVGDGVDVSLGTVVSDRAGDFATRATLPRTAVPGAYTVAVRSGRGTLASAALTIARSLTVTTSTRTIRAGRALQLSVGQIDQPADLVVDVGSRRVHGPVAASLRGASIELLLPADLAASYPAALRLTVRLVRGRSLLQQGALSIDVQAPYTGPSLALTDTRSSSATVTASQPFQLSGRLRITDDTPTENVTFSAWWFGDNGQVLPLSGPPVRLADDGSFALDTAAPSVGSLSFADARGPGQVRFIGRSDGRFSTGPEHVIVEGPRISTGIDTDDDIDVRITVLGFDYDGTPLGPLEAAFVSVSGNALVAPAEPAGATMRAVGQFALSQVTPLAAGFIDSCPATLYTRYTDAAGQTELLIERASSFSTLTSTSLAVHAVEPDCHPVPTNPLQTACFGGGEETDVSEFLVSVYGHHLGFGRLSSDIGGEMPESFRIRHDRSEQRFTITNLTTGEVREHVGTSAPLGVQLRRNPLGNRPLVGAPVVDGLRAMPSNLVSFGQQRGVEFTPLIDFGQATATLDFSGAPRDRFVEFTHVRDAVGNLDGASLHLAGRKIGDFTRKLGSGVCPTTGTLPSETWRLDLPEEIELAFRYPGLQWDGNRVCGYIEARSAGRTGRRELCFNWTPGPDYLRQPGRYTVNDRYPGYGQAQIGGTNRVGPALATRMPDPGYDVGERNNESDRVLDRFDTIDAGAVSSTITALVTSNKQFERTPDDDPGGELPAGATIGSNTWQVLLDQTFPLFRWYWGIEGLFGAEVFADLRLLAEYYFRAVSRVDNTLKELNSRARFTVMLTIGVDIDVLFGLVADAGASITAAMGSEMGVKIVDGQEVDSETGAFFNWGFYFDGWVSIGCPIDLVVDPTCWIPDVEESFVIAEGQEQIAKADHRKALTPPAITPREQRPPLTDREKVDRFRHPAIAYDRSGNGMVIALDDTRRLIGTPLIDGQPGTPQVISTGLGLRSTAITFLSTRRAVAVWAESTLPEATFATATLAAKANAQRLHYALWNGSTWTAKQPLWSANGGDAHPALAACTSSLCARGGAATLVFGHDAAADIGNPDMRVYSARFSPSTGFSSPRLVDPSTERRLDVSPTVTYVDTTAVVAFVRYTTPDLAAVASRQLVYRFLGTGALEVAGELPDTVASPSLSANGSTLRIAFTRPDDGSGFVGTRQALHYAEGSCAEQRCQWRFARLRDAHGRPLYGQAPTLLADGDGEPLMVFRAFGYGAGDDGRAVRQGDPLGTATLTGELMQVRPELASGRFSAQALSIDGRMHFQPAAALDAFNGRVAALSVITDVAGLGKAAREWQPLLGASKAPATVATKLGDGDGVELRQAAVLADPALLALRVDGSAFVAGSRIEVELAVENRGGLLDADQAAAATITLRFDDVAGAAPALASVPLPTLAAGEMRTLTVPLTIPAGLDPDVGHTLVATLVATDTFMQADDGNDVAMLRLGDLPVPAGLHGEVHPGQPFARVGWDAVGDPRVIGYRVYAEDAPGVRTPLGSSDVAGFLDLAAQYGTPRTYFVTAYTARGIESDFSTPIVVTPPLALLAGSTPPPAGPSIFRDGFEGR